MKECYDCRAPLPKGTARFKIDGRLLCVNCADRRRKEHKQEVLAAINAGTAPVEIFHIPQVVLPNSNCKYLHRMGDLIFLNKGVCFVEMVELAAARDTAWLGILASLLLPIPIGINANNPNNTRMHYIVRYHQLAAYYSQFGLQGMLTGAIGLVFVPKEQIREIKWGRLGNLQIHTNNPEEKKSFILISGKKTYRECKHDIDEYMGNADT